MFIEYKINTKTDPERIACGASGKLYLYLSPKNFPLNCLF